MIELDWSDYDDDQAPAPVDPGFYLGEISRCAEKRSSTGDVYLNVQLRETDTGKFLCFDTIMLTGRGKNIGLAKLSQLGFDKTMREISASALLGKRVWLFLKHESHDGVLRAKVDIRRFRCGYLDPAGKSREDIQRIVTGNERVPF